MIAPINAIPSDDPNNRVVHPIASFPAQFGAVRPDSFASSQWVARAPRWWENWFGLSGKQTAYQSGSSSSSAAVWVLGLLVTVGVGGLLTHHFRTKTSGSSSSSGPTSRSGSPSQLPQAGNGSGGIAGKGGKRGSRGASGGSGSGTVSSTRSSYVPPPPIDHPEKKNVEALTAKITSVMQGTKWEWKYFDDFFPTIEKHKLTPAIRDHLKVDTPYGQAFKRKQQETFKSFCEGMGLKCSNEQTGMVLTVDDGNKWKQCLQHPDYRDAHFSIILKSFNQVGNTKLADSLITFLLTNAETAKKDETVVLSRWRDAYRDGRADALDLNHLNASRPHGMPSGTQSLQQLMTTANYTPSPNATIWANDYKGNKGITEQRPVVGFYESNKFGYILSNTASSKLTIKGEVFDTLEEALQMAKFVYLKSQDPTKYAEIQAALKIDSRTGGPAGPGQFQTNIRNYECNDTVQNFALTYGVQPVHGGYTRQRGGWNNGYDYWYSKKEWQTRSMTVLDELLAEKLKVNTEFRDLMILLKKEKAILVEDAGSNDDFYGAGRDGKGQNRLGLALMKLYDKLP